jgi:hypothetical protein
MSSCAGERLAYPRVLQKDAEAHGSESEEDLPPVDVWRWTCVYVGDSECSVIEDSTKTRTLEA